MTLGISQYLTAFVAQMQAHFLISWTLLTLVPNSTASSPHASGLVSPRVFACCLRELMILPPIVGRSLGSRLRYYAIAAVSTYGSVRIVLPLGSQYVNLNI